MKVHDVEQLVRRLAGMPREKEWLEFKLNNFNAETFGKYISALANSAIFSGEDCGYLVLGVKDETHNIVGTEVRLDSEKVGNETFLHWLSKYLMPRVNIEHHIADIEGKHVELLAVSHGYQQPVRFKEVAYIRIDTSLHPLTSHAERERAIWQASNRFSFEQAIARSHVSGEHLVSSFEVNDLLDSLGVNRQSVPSAIEYLVQEDLIRDNRQGGFDVTNLFVLAAAKDMRTFAGLERKGSRVIVYKDKTKIETVREIHGRMGYGVSFNALLAFVMSHMNPKEEMQHGKRVVVHSIPSIAIREIIANSIIHQDFTIAGDGPVVEVFSDRIKITNPGRPLIPTDRFIDAPSRSRNSKFGHLMRRLGLCEERGSGVDRALWAIERAVLPPPLFQDVEDTTVVTLYARKLFADMTKEERVRACYQHACLCTEKNEPMSNASLRTRLGLTDKQYPQVSLVIADAREAQVIRALDEDQAKRNARYVPYWY